MKKLRISLLIIAASAALTGILWLAISLYSRIGTPSESPFNAIPGNTAMIIKLNKASTLIEELDRSNLLWKAISRFPGVNAVKKELHFIDSLFRLNEGLRKRFLQSDVLVSVTLSGRNNFGTLYLTAVEGKAPDDHLLSFLKEAGKEAVFLTETPYFTTRLHRVQFKGSRNPVYFAVIKGVLLASRQPDLVKKGIDRLSLNTPLAASPGFRLVESTSGKKADANVFINYRFFSLVLSKITRVETVPDLIRFAFFADWSGFDLIVKKDELLFSGITVASDSNQHFLSLFSDQKPLKAELPSVIPDHSLYFINYSWSDPARFSLRIQNKPPREETFSLYQSAVSRLSRQYQVNVSDFFLPWIDREGGIFLMPGGNNGLPVTYAAFHCSDGPLAVRKLGELAKAMNVKADSSPYKGRMIHRIPLTGFLPALFGEQFAKTDPRCFTILNGFIIFAPSPQDLEPVINAWLNNTTLANDKIYQDFSSDLSETSNIYCYFNTRYATGFLVSQLGPELNLQLAPVMDSLRKFESIAFQFSNLDGLFYSNLLLRYDPNLGKEGPLSWEIKMDTTITDRPRIIRGAPHTPPFILASDISGNLYRISASGKIEWKIQLMGKKLGEIQPLKLPGNDSLFLLFNTDTHLYMIREDGLFAEKFPMRFPMAATSPVTLLEPTGGEPMTILVALRDHRVYHFGLDGLSVSDWLRPGLEENITAPVNHLKTRGRDYLCISGEEGHSLIVDLHGKKIIDPGIRFTHSAQSNLYVNHTHKKGLFITSGTAGDIQFIQDNGLVNPVNLNPYTPAHYFFYEDIIPGGSQELIIIDKNRIDYYQENLKLVYTYSFRRDVTSPPFLIRLPDQRIMVGLRTPETNELSLFDMQGNREMGSGIRGNTPFDLGYLTDHPGLSLVVGYGKFLRCYRLPDF